MLLFYGSGCNREDTDIDIVSFQLSSHCIFSFLSIYIWDYITKWITVRISVDLAKSYLNGRGKDRKNVIMQNLFCSLLGDVGLNFLWSTSCIFFISSCWWTISSNINWSLSIFCFRLSSVRWFLIIHFKLSKI